VNSIAAGAISGAVFKSTRGLRPMMISSGIVATVAGAWAVRSAMTIGVIVTNGTTGYEEGGV